jgi:hypothetical protein
MRGMVLREIRRQRNYNGASMKQTRALWRQCCKRLGNQRGRGVQVTHNLGNPNTEKDMHVRSAPLYPAIPSSFLRGRRGSYSRWEVRYLSGLISHSSGSIPRLLPTQLPCVIGVPGLPRQALHFASVATLRLQKRLALFRGSAFLFATYCCSFCVTKNTHNL